MTAPDLKPCPFCGATLASHVTRAQPAPPPPAPSVPLDDSKSARVEAYARPEWNTRAPAEALAVPEVAALVYAAKMVMHDLHHGNGLEGLYENRDRLDAALRAIGVNRDVHIEPDTGRKLSDALAFIAEIGVCHDNKG